ncbi:hypothetical protein, partial [Pseudomonas sp. CFII64]|uniref:hypothetical protein n=1 Tax=Pseudomonas sp. CFII64 TaxID=911242 RepID=UPI001C43AAD0
AICTKSATTKKPPISHAGKSGVSAPARWVAASFILQKMRPTSVVYTILLFLNDALTTLPTSDYVRAVS